jgi:hypothetical protein
MIKIIKGFLYKFKPRLLKHFFLSYIIRQQVNLGEYLYIHMVVLGRGLFMNL